MSNSTFQLINRLSAKQNGDSPKEKFSVNAEFGISNPALSIGETFKSNDKKGRDWSTTLGDDTVRMKRQIGLLSGIAFIVGTTLGSGIFITPAKLLQRTDSVAISLAVWAVCGLLSMFGALTYCELGTVIPRSGGDHAYFMAAYKPRHKFWGEIPAFLFSWMTATLVKPSSLAILSLSFAKYVLLPFTESGTICRGWKSSQDSEYAQRFLAVCCVGITAFINIQSSKLAARVQVLFTCAKLLAPAIVIAVGLYNLALGEFGDLPDHFDESDAGFKIVTAFYGGLYAYNGWRNLNYLTEELINPSRNLPLAICIAMPLITAIYLLMNMSYLTVLTKAEITGSSAIGLEFADRKLGTMSFVLPVLIALSIFGTANGIQFTGSRIAYAAARDGHLVDVLSYVHVQKLTPTVAILFNSGLALCMISYSNINSLIDTFSFVAWIFYGLAFIGLFVLRAKSPDLDRPFRVPLIISAIGLLMSVFLVVIPLYENPNLSYFIPLGYSLVGLGLYYPFVYKKRALGCMGKVTRLIQCVTLSAPSPYTED